MRRWLKSTSNRTFVLWPVLLFCAEALLQEGMPRLQPWALALLAWGYLQYRWVGAFRAREGGGGPGVAIPPERIVDRGPYRWVRNPMYLGDLIFLQAWRWYSNWLRRCACRPRRVSIAARRRGATG